MCLPTTILVVSILTIVLWLMIKYGKWAIVYFVIALAILLMLFGMRVGGQVLDPPSN